MAKIVIAGAGPMGLFLAIILHKNGFTDLLLCDPRLGHYTRTGHVIDKTVQLIQTFCDVSWEDTSYISIKSIEKKLYQKVKSLGIACTHEPFMGLIKTPRGALIGTTPVACDWVLDCTGTKRQVLHTFNELSDVKHLFQINTDFLPFFKNHMVASIRFPFSEKMQEQLLTRMNYLYIHMQTNDLKPTWVTEFLSTHLPALQSLGWYGYKLPQCYPSPLDKNRIIRLYLQYPDGLTAEKYVQWLNLILTIYLQKLPDYTLHTSPKSPTGFEVFPLNFQNISPAVIKQSAYPGVGMLGDALMNYDYRLGNGISLNIKIIMGFFLPHFKKMPFNIKKYNAVAKQFLREARYMLINKELKEYEVEGFFEQSFQTVPNNHLVSPPWLRTQALIGQINNCINEKSCFHSTEILNINHPINTLDHLLVTLIDIRKRFGSHNINVIKTIDENLLFWSTIFHKKADESMENQCWVLAKTLYSMSMSMSITLEISTASSLLYLASKYIRTLIIQGQDKNLHYKKALNFGRKFLPLIPHEAPLTQASIDELNTLLNNLLLAWFLINKKTTPEKQMQFLALCLRFKPHWREGIASQLIRLGLLPPEQSKKKNGSEKTHLHIF